MNKTLLVISVSAAFLFAVGLYQVTNSSKIFPQSKPSQFDTEQIFIEWLNGKSVKYTSNSEYLYRANIFKQNYEFVLESNQNPSNTYQLVLNEFSDITAEEFKAMYLGFKKSNRPRNYGNFENFESSKIPNSRDWREEGAVTPIKQQGGCGSCWAFSTIGTLEGAYAIKTKKLVPMSEQQLVDCDRENDLGCGGGAMDYAFEYLMKHGIESEKSYPYIGREGICSHKEVRSEKGVKVTGFKDVPEANEPALRAAASQQPVGVAIEARMLQFYGSGVYNNSLCKAELDHGVLLVGYGTEKGHDFWLVKNSWGTSWGEKGFIRFARHNVAGKIGMCGITEQSSYPILG